MRRRSARLSPIMNADIGEVVIMIVAVNAGAMLLLVVMSFVGSALALEGLERLDTWMGRQDEKRPPPSLKLRAELTMRQSQAGYKRSKTYLYVNGYSGRGADEGLTIV